jgi:hypothetical protein
MVPNQKLPLLSSKTEKKRAELTLLVILVNDFPSYRKIPSNAAIQILPFLSCMMLRVMRLGPWELIMSAVSDLPLSFGKFVVFCPAHQVQETNISNANKCIHFIIFFWLSRISADSGGRKPTSFVPELFERTC